MTNILPPMTERLLQAADEALYSTSGHEDMSLYPILAELEDLDTIPGELGEPEDGKGLLKMVNSVELSMALWSANELGVRNDLSAIFDKVEHEREHGDAITSLGLRAVHAVRFKLLDSGGVGMKATTIPVGQGITKLGFASFLARPKRLSNSDIRKLRIIGYKDARDIADHILDSGADIPMPLSVR